MSVKNPQTFTRLTVTDLPGAARAISDIHDKLAQVGASIPTGHSGTITIPGGPTLTVTNGVITSVK